ncbi:hypothetical protein BDD12DRAFT_844892 [Trichophaea hybrida]|nr:hypothetical protein BDD12DRAFT_844892 [Trichophaea hybrida]
MGPRNSAYSLVCRCSEDMLVCNAAAHEYALMLQNTKRIMSWGGDCEHVLCADSIIVAEDGKCFYMKYMLIQMAIRCCSRMQCNVISVMEIVFLCAPIGAISRVLYNSSLLLGGNMQLLYFLLIGRRRSPGRIMYLHTHLDISPALLKTVLRDARV